MIYFIEHDSAGNICHVCADPSATIIPTANRIFSSDSSGNPLKDAEGNLLSPYGLPLADPDEISEAEYKTLISGGVSNYSYEVGSGSIVKKAGA
jgi:hypothetical protein